MRNHLFISAAFLTLQNLPSAAAAEKPTPFLAQPLLSKNKPECIHIDHFLTCTTRGDLISNPKMDLHDKSQAPGVNATYLFVIIVENPAPTVESIITFDLNGNISSNFSPLKLPTIYNIAAVYADVLPSGKCVYEYFYDITSIALSKNPSVPTAIKDMLDEASQLAISPDDVYTAPLFDDRPKCVLLSSLLPSLKMSPRPS